MEYLYVFLIGGALCVIAQLLIDKTKLTPANILVLYVCVGVVLGGAGLYGKLVGFASSGATVPLTGFGYAIAEGIKEAVREKGLFGALTGGFAATAAGICACTVFAVLWAALFRPKNKS